MPTNLAIDDALLALALELGGLRTKRETVNVALEEFVARRQRRRAVAAFGQVTFDDSWDYKQARKKR